VPTTTFRLSCTAGVLPPEHAFNADAYKIVLDAEAANLDHLNTNLKNIQDGFVLYKTMQDGCCLPYEEMAQSFVQNEGAATASFEERRDDTTSAARDVRYSLF
jgi:hypothetical protein